MHILAPYYTGWRFLIKGRMNNENIVERVIICVFEKHHILIKMKLVMKKYRIFLTAILIMIVAVLTLTAILAVGLATIRQTYEETITVHVDGAVVACDVSSVLENDRVYLSMRAAAEAMGARVFWDNHVRSIHVEKSKYHS